MAIDKEEGNARTVVKLDEELQGQKKMWAKVQEGIEVIMPTRKQAQAENKKTQKKREVDGL